MIEVISLSGSLANSGKDGVATMLSRDIAN
jgi:hypothetical protein